MILTFSRALLRHSPPLRSRAHGLHSRVIHSQLKSAEVQSVPKRMFAGMALACSFALALPLCYLAQFPSPFPVDVTVSPAPQPVTADGKIRLLYERNLTNFSPKPIDCIGLNVLGGESCRSLASYGGEALKKLMFMVGSSDDAATAGGAKVQAIDGGRSVVIFLDLTLDRGVRAPAELRHRLSLSITGKNGTMIEKTIRGPTVAIDQEPVPVPVLQAPLHGARWVAFNGLSNPDHRRAWIPVGGKVRIAQRFAIDWLTSSPMDMIFTAIPNQTPVIMTTARRCSR